MKGRHGFTLMEVMIAAMLSGMIFLAALPLILTGQKLARQMEEKEAANIAGDAVFEDVKEKLMYADRIFLGNDPENELLDEGEWKPVCGSCSMRGMDMVTEFCTVGSDCIRLTVKLVNEKKCIYERTEEVRLLNLSLHEDRQIEGDADGKEQTVLWYQGEGREDE